MQLLEGPADKVDHLIDPILAEARHTSIKVLVRDKTEVPYIAHWAMAFQHKGDGE